MRGYVAMLVVDKAYRGKGIGKYAKPRCMGIVELGPQHRSAMEAGNISIMLPARAPNLSTIAVLPCLRS
jgi:hypothetical protein